MQYCQRPGCAVLVSRGFCPVHAPLQYERQRAHSTARGYSKAWRQRAALFRQRYPLCGMRPDNQPPVMSACYDAKIPTLGDQVDHVVPHRGDHARFWDEHGNWQTLCASCGARKSAAGL